MHAARFRIALMIVLALSIGRSNLFAQEQVPQKEVIKYAFGLGMTAATQKDPPLKTTPDPYNSSAVHKEGQIAVLIPDQAFKEDLLSKVSEKEITPLGQIWLRDLVPQVEGKSIAADKLRTLTIDAGKEKITAHLCFLGLQKNDKGEIQLIVYGKGKEILLKPVIAAHEEKQEKPLVVGMQAPADKPLLVTLSLFGKHQTQFEVAPAPVK